MEGAENKEQGNEKLVTEVKTFSPFHLQSKKKKKENLTCKTNTSSKEQIIYQAIQFHLK